MNEEHLYASYAYTNAPLTYRLCTKINFDSQMRKFRTAEYAQNQPHRLIVLLNYLDVHLSLETKACCLLAAKKHISTLSTVNYFVDILLLICGNLFI